METKILFSIFSLIRIYKFDNNSFGIKRVDCKGQSLKDKIKDACKYGTLDRTPKKLSFR